MHGSQLYCLRSTAARITPSCDVLSLTNHMYARAAWGQGGSLCKFQLMNWGSMGKVPLFLPGWDLRCWTCAGFWGTKPLSAAPFWASGFALMAMQWQEGGGGFLPFLATGHTCWVKVPPTSCPDPG